MHFPELSTLIASFGYLGIGGIVFAESGLFFGFFLPGDSLLFTAGLLASQGHLSIFVLMILICASAIAGDSVGYWFGKKIGRVLFSRKNSLWFSHKLMEDAKRFFDRHGPKSIILARFIPAVRTFTPIVAGVAEMDYKKFLTYNVLGGILWGVGIPLVGYFLGAAIPGIDRYLLPFSFLVILVSFLPIALEFFRKKR